MRALRPSFICRAGLLTALAIGPCLVAHADTIYTFEDLPDAYFFNSGDQNIGTFYSGITFGPDVTGLSVSRFGGYDDSGFPPHSGDVVIWDASDATINISFDAPLQSFGIWYTTFDPLTLEAFDSGGNSLGTTTGDPNTDGTTGMTSFLSLSDPGIASVALTSTPGFFTLDDMTIDTGASAVPEPGSFSFIAVFAAFVAWLSLFSKFRSVVSTVRGGVGPVLGRKSPSATCRE